MTRQEIQEQLWGAETFVDFEQGVNKCIKQIRTALNDNADNPLYIETLPRRGYRFLPSVVAKTILSPRPRVVESDSGVRPRVPALTGGSGMPATIAGAAAPCYAVAAPQSDAVSAQLEGAIRPTSADSIHQPRPRIWRRRAVWIMAAAVTAVAAFAVLYPHVHVVTIKYADLMKIKQAELTEKDTIVLADFDNKTGDPVFDDALKQGLTIQLEQSTTPSLEALRAYTLGRKTLFAKGETAALPFFKRAVELDPNFAKGIRLYVGCLRQPQPIWPGGGECTQGFRTAEQGERTGTILYRGELLPVRDGRVRKRSARLRTLAADIPKGCWALREPRGHFRLPWKLGKDIGRATRGNAPESE